MAVYRQIHVSFWQDSFVLELTPEEKYFYLYLMTNSKTKQCGCYELPLKVMVLETGYDYETINKLLDRFINYGKIDYCKETKEILIKNWHKYNISKSPSVLSCIKKEIAEIKHQPFFQHCIYTVPTQCGETGGNNNKKNNKKNNNNKNKNNILFPESEEEKLKPPFTSKEQEQMFSLFYKQYPKKKSRGQAEKTWVKLKIDKALFKEILEGLEKAKSSKKWNKDNGEFIPHPSTWLNAKGWEDEYTAVSDGDIESSVPFFRE